MGSESEVVPITHIMSLSFIFQKYLCHIFRIKFFLMCVRNFSISFTLILKRNQTSYALVSKTQLYSLFVPTGLIVSRPHSTKSSIMGQIILLWQEETLLRCSPRLPGWTCNRVFSFIPSTQAIQPHFRVSGNSNESGSDCLSFGWRMRLCLNLLQQLDD